MAGLFVSPMKTLGSVDPGRLLIFALSMVLTFAVAAAAGYSLRSPEHEALSIPAAGEQANGVKGVVQAVTADSITLKTDAGVLTFKISPSTPKEAIQRTTLASIKPGDWVNAGGVRHNQTIYALTDLVIIPAADLGAR